MRSAGEISNVRPSPSTKGAPVRTDAESPVGITLESERVAALASYLMRRDVRRCVVLTCRRHDEDQRVAVQAASRAGVSILVLDADDDRLEVTLAQQRGATIVACEEGVNAWTATGLHFQVIGDGPGVLWWKAVELQEMETMRLMSAVDKAEEEELAAVSGSERCPI